MRQPESNAPGGETGRLRVSGIFLYPVKSLGGIAVDAAEVTKRGLRRDRRWMVVDRDGQFLTQRTHPHLCRIATALDGDAIVLSAAGHGSFALPVEVEDGPRREVSVWRFRGPAIEHAAGGAWLSLAFGSECRLVYMPDDVARAVNPDYGRADDIVSFADAYPLLLTGAASLDDLNRRLDVPIEMRRFRPNLVVAGGTPFAEDTWRRLRIGAVPLRNAKPCDRCVVTTVDPETGETSREPLRTLARFRARDGAVWFGVNLLPDGAGTIRVGDAVFVLEEQAPWVGAGARHA